MYNIKIALTVFVPGAKMLSEKVCQSDPENNYKVVSIPVTTKVWDKKKHKNVFLKDRVTFNLRKSEKVAHTINMSQEAYESFIDPKNVPSWWKKTDWKKWKAMTDDARLEEHMKRTAEYFGGTEYSYQVFED